jgi:diguanylate cyclase (GGDEF)-like protein/PAS domain S-box-containing protein
MGMIQPTIGKQLESERSTSLELLSVCMAHINDVVLITDAWPFEKGGPRIVYVNDAFERVTGYTRAHAIGQSPRFLQGKNTPAAELAHLALALKTGHAGCVELINYTQAGAEMWVDLHMVPVKNAQGQCVNVINIQRDVTERKKAQAQVEQLTHHDALTGLANHRLLADRLKQTLAACARQPVYCGLLAMDIDNFKFLNGTLGRSQGDALLVEVAKRLVGCVRNVDTVARMEGGAFVVLIQSVGADAAEAASNAETVARKLLNRLRKSFSIDDAPYHLTVSLGIALFNNAALPMGALFTQADLAVYQAKTVGGNTFRFFDAEMQIMADERSWLGGELRHALAKKQLTLHYQAQFDAAHGLVGAEALLRWDCPSRGHVSPAVFIPLAEKIGLIRPLGKWVLEEACQTLARWSTLPALSGLTLSINVSPKQFQMPDFVASVMKCLHRKGARPDRLKLELTEGLMIHDLRDVNTKMAMLKAHGIGLSLDDFGTGYASLNYLRRLSLDQLKIDRTFIQNALTDENDAAITRTIVTLGQSLGLEVLAEGVETLAQKEFLTAIGCHAFQGYFFSQPLPLLAFEDFVANRGKAEALSPGGGLDAHAVPAPAL